MPNRRLDLHEILVGALGSRNVYFQPPSTIKMRYPCIVYRRAHMDAKHANNRLYALKTAYQVVVMDDDPDSIIPLRIAQLPLCRFDTHYTADNLYHDVYTLYY